MPNGVIKFFNTRRGFGFIRDDNGGTDTFFHMSQLIDDNEYPIEGQKCEYEMATDERSGKPCAIKVRAIE